MIYYSEEMYGMTEKSEEVKEVIAWLQFCYEMLEAGQEDRIPYDPFYKSSRFPEGVITDDYVERVVKVIEAEFVFELIRYPAYHFQHADGATVPPEFTRLSSQGRRAMVQGLDRLISRS